MRTRVSFSATLGGGGMVQKGTARHAAAQRAETTSGSRHAPPTATPSAGTARAGSPPTQNLSPRSATTLSSSTQARAHGSATSTFSGPTTFASTAQSQNALPVFIDPRARPCRTLHACRATTPSPQTLSTSPMDTRQRRTIASGDARPRPCALAESAQVPPGSSVRL